jgi:hypothetical protein
MAYVSYIRCSSLLRDNELPLFSYVSLFSLTNQLSSVQFSSVQLLDQLALSFISDRTSPFPLFSYVSYIN